MTTETKVKCILQELHDSEINFTVSCCWHGGFEVKLGDEMNGSKEEGQVDTWAEVAPWLERAALEHYPKSAFATSR